LLSRSCGARASVLRGPIGAHWGPVGPPETAKSHRVARKAAAHQYLIFLFSLSFSLSFPISLVSFLPSVRPFSIGPPPLLRSIPSTSSLSLSLSYSSYFTITISGSSRSLPLSALPALLFGVSLSFIKYIYLTHECRHARTHARTHACLIIMRTYEIVSAGPLRLLYTNIHVSSFVIISFFTGHRSLLRAHQAYSLILQSVTFLHREWPHLSYQKILLLSSRDDCVARSSMWNADKIPRRITDDDEDDVNSSRGKPVSRDVVTRDCF